MPFYLQELVFQYGYLILYASLALGILGLPVPDEVLLTFVGYVATEGLLSYPTSILVGFAGAMTGMSLSYYIGKKLGRPLLWNKGRLFKLTPKRLAKVEDWFHRFGLWTVSFGYFIPGFRHIPCYLSGISAVQFRKYIRFAGIGAMVWCIFFISIGYLLGNTLDFSSSILPQIFSR